jgi:serine/threonine protein kinase
MSPFSNAWLLQVSILKKCTHPNIVTIIGICLEASALVYEWLPNGNLEDYIVSSNNSPPLPWCKRTQIIGDVCCTLLFLHANKPSALVHGDLRPCNILIDANYRSKLCNFGMSNLFLAPGAFPPNLNVRLPYMDPEFLTTEELTPQSDIYSLGVIILRLLTGMSPLSIAKKVASALESDSLHLMIDKSAGDWPYMQAKQLAVLSLSCVETTPEKRPDLLTQVWKVIEPMATRPLVTYFQSASGGSSAPAHFFCPIRMVINSASTLLDQLGQMVITGNYFLHHAKKSLPPGLFSVFFLLKNPA